MRTRAKVPIKRGYVPNSLTALQRENRNLHSDSSSGRARRQGTPPQLQPPALIQLIPPRHWGEGIQSHTRDAGSQLRVNRRCKWRTAQRGPRALDSREVRGRQQRRRKPPLLLAGPAFTGVRPWRRSPADRPPSSSRERPGSPDLPARRAGSPAPAMTSVPRLEAVRGRSQRGQGNGGQLRERRDAATLREGAWGSQRAAEHEGTENRGRASCFQE